jgi:hypothetical protein
MKPWACVTTKAIMKIGLRRPEGATMTWRCMRTKMVMRRRKRSPADAVKLSSAVFAKQRASMRRRKRKRKRKTMMVRGVTRNEKAWRSLDSSLGQRWEKTGDETRSLRRPGPVVTFWRPD